MSETDGLWHTIDPPVELSGRPRWFVHYTQGGSRWTQSFTETETAERLLDRLVTHRPYIFPVTASGLE